MRPLTLYGLVDRIRSGNLDHVRTHSLFALRAAMRKSPEISVNRAETALESCAPNLKRAEIWGIRIVEDPRVPVGVAVLMQRVKRPKMLHEVIAPFQVAALTSDAADRAGSFSGRMSFLTRGLPVPPAPVIPFKGSRGVRNARS